MTPARPMRRSLFHSGLIPRLAAAALYGGFAFGAVALLEPSATDRAADGPAKTAPATASEGTSRATLCLESLQPVATWDVRVDGVRIAPRHADTTTWLADLTLGSGAALVVDASPAGDPPGARNALRIRIAGTAMSRDQTFWLERDWSIAARAEHLAPAPAPIDPEDLP